MKAITWHGKHDVRCETVDDPEILNPRDAIIRVTSTAICGSDLHLYDGFIPAMKKGDVSGPIKTAQGWHVIRLEDVREKGVRPLTEVRDQISNALRLRRAQETEQAYLTFMTNKTPVNINEAELTKLQGAK